MSDKAIVAVQYASKDGIGYGGREYSYYSDVALKVGDIVNAPTKYGSGRARVAKTGIKEEDIPPALLKYFKTITAECIPEPDGNKPAEQINMTSIAEDFFSK